MIPRWVPTLLAVWLSTAACGGDRATRQSLTVDGVERNYYLHVPSTRPANAPVVLVFHGGGPAGKSKGRGVARFSGFNQIADKHGFIVAYPSSYAGNWGDGRPTPYAPPPEVDDLAFTDAVIDDIAKRYPIDRKRIFATGASNGGFFSMRLACERTDTFAAIAPVIASMRVDHGCQPTRPIPILMIAGDQDPAVKWEGGPVAQGKEDRGKSISVPDATRFWVDHNRCTDPPDTKRLADRDPTDGTTVKRTHWKTCASSTEVVQLRVEGGGHTWPGGRQYLPEAWIGKTSQDFDASKRIWRFFKQHQRP